ncbi:MAG: FAD:protein FMN transferase [Gammaproteobacteria bacterium]
MSRLARCQPNLGTYVEVIVSGDVNEDELISASNAAFLKINLIQSLMSFHDEGSELTRINRYAAREPVPISLETKFVLEQALWLSDKTDGLFDITVAPKLVASKALPNHNFDLSPTGNWRDIIIIDNEVRFTRPLLLDLGGIAKGYAVDQAIDVVDDSINITVNAGGDLRMRPWRGNQVEVRHPRSPHSESIQIQMKNCAVATSATYYSENGVLIVPKDPRASVNLDKNISVSVFAKDCLLADALTKVAYLDPDMIKKSVFPDIEFMTLDCNNLINWY